MHFVYPQPSTVCFQRVKMSTQRPPDLYTDHAIVAGSISEPIYASLIHEYLFGILLSSHSPGGLAFLNSRAII
jgi:hypothetical protein